MAYSKRILDLLDCYALNLNCFHRHILRPSFRRLGLPLLSVGLKRNRKLKGCEHKEIFSGNSLEKNRAYRAVNSELPAFPISKRNRSRHATAFNRDIPTISFVVGARGRERQKERQREGEGMGENERK